MPDFLVKIEDRVWDDFMRPSAFETAEEALRHIITMGLYRGDPTGISTKLVIVTGKVQVTKIPPKTSGRAPPGT